MHVDGGVEGVGAWRGAVGGVPALYEGGGGKGQGEAGCVRDTQTERPGEGPFPSPDQELMIASVRWLFWRTLWYRAIIGDPITLSGLSSHITITIT